MFGAALTAQIGFSVPEQGLPTLAGFLRADLSLSAAATGLAVSSFFVGKLLGADAAGVVVDRVGEYRVLLASAFVSGSLLAVAMAFRDDADGSRTARPGRGGDRFAVTFNFLAIVVPPPLYGLVADVAGTYRAVCVGLSLAFSLRRSCRRASSAEARRLKGVLRDRPIYEPLNLAAAPVR